MSLPLKTLADSTPAQEISGFAAGSRKQSMGVPLTPLMAKLSVLALNEEQRWDAGNNASNIEIQTPLTSSKHLPRRSSLKCEDAVDALSVFNSLQSKNGFQRLQLYVCGQQNMTMLLLMEEGSAQQKSIVQKMVSNFIQVIRSNHNTKLISCILFNWMSYC